MLTHTKHKQYTTWYNDGGSAVCGLPLSHRISYRTVMVHPDQLDHYQAFSLAGLLHTVQASHIQQTSFPLLVKCPGWLSSRYKVGRINHQAFSLSHLLVTPCPSFLPSVHPYSSRQASSSTVPVGWLLCGWYCNGSCQWRSTRVSVHYTVRR